MSPSPSSSPPEGGGYREEYNEYREEDDVPLRPSSRNWPTPPVIESLPLPSAKVWKEDIVISGISGRYPESSNIDEFWQKLTSGVELISCDDRRWPVGKNYEDNTSCCDCYTLSNPFDSCCQLLFPAPQTVCYVCRPGCFSFSFKSYVEEAVLFSCSL